MPAFERWGTAHLAAIAITAVLPLILAAWSRHGDKANRTRVVGIGFALLLVGEILAQFLYSDRGTVQEWQELVPLHVCDMALFACVIACLTRKQLAFEIAYFWGLGGTMHGLITPDLEAGFPSPQFWLFFVGHGGIVGCVLYLVFGMQLRPNLKSVVRVFYALLAYAVVSGLFNLMFGTNYGYTRAKPGAGSLMDLLGPWPWYIGSLIVVAVLSFFILYLPWLIKDRLEKQRETS